MTIIFRLRTRSHLYFFVRIDPSSRLVFSNTSTDCLEMFAIFLILFAPLTADALDEIDAKKECDKWVHEGGTYLIWKKDWKQVDGGMQRKWKIKRVSKRVCQMDQLSNQFIGLEYQVRNGKVLSKSEIIGKRHQLIIKRTFLFKP